MKKLLIGIITGALLIVTTVFVTANDSLNQAAKVKSTDNMFTALAEKSMPADLTYWGGEGNFIKLGSHEKSTEAGVLKGTAKKEKLTIDDYMSMFDSIDEFKTFVGKRDDLTKSDKKKVIEARTQQVKISNELLEEYEKLLTDEELEVYLNAPVMVAVEAGAVPEDNKLYDNAVSKIDKATKKDKHLAELSKKLVKIKSGEPYYSFIKKVEWEKSKLLGF